MDPLSSTCAFLLLIKTMRVMLKTLHFGDVLPGNYRSIVSLPWVVMIRNSVPLEAGDAFQVVTKYLGIFVTVYDNKPWQT